ncbi:hypothetical protein AMECASPLE_011037 [Ameca splendens]|uniref:Uncharacterized protein n=1 Tax=Ameca splendens TaxID=208324 RepID=A0ABV1A7G2_9TELE
MQNSMFSLPGAPGIHYLSLSLAGVQDDVVAGAPLSQVAPQRKSVTNLLLFSNHSPYQNVSGHTLLQTRGLKPVLLGPQVTFWTFSLLKTLGKNDKCNHCF